jgi:hypothetical protein
LKKGQGSADVGKGLTVDKWIGRRVQRLGGTDRPPLKKGEAYKFVDDDGGGEKQEIKVWK